MTKHIEMLSPLDGSSSTFTESLANIITIVPLEILWTRFLIKDFLPRFLPKFRSASQHSAVIHTCFVAWQKTFHAFSCFFFLSNAAAEVKASV